MDVIDVDSGENDDCETEKHVFKDDPVGPRLRLGLPKLFVIGFQNHEILVRDDAVFFEDGLSFMDFKHDGTHHVCRFFPFGFCEILIVCQIAAAYDGGQYFFE